MNLPDTPAFDFRKHGFDFYRVQMVKLATDTRQMPPAKRVIDGRPACVSLITHRIAKTRCGEIITLHDC
jgi:hypothetical protein